MFNGDWLPRELSSCAGLTSLRLQDCHSSSNLPTMSTQSHVALSQPPSRLPNGVYLRNLRQLYLVDCHFAAFPTAISGATALRLLMCTNRVVRRSASVPDTPFKAKTAAGVLASMEWLRELRLRASDWKPSERRSLGRLLPEVRIVYYEDWPALRTWMFDEASL